MKTKNKSLKPVLNLLRSRRDDWTLEPDAAKDIRDAFVALDHSLAVRDVRRATKAMNHLARVFLRNAP